MKSLDRAIERFCYKHPRFGIPNLMMVIVIGNVIAYILSLMDTTGTFLYYLVFSPELIFKGQIWRLVSFVFVPDSTSLLSFAISVYFYYFIGTSLQGQWGQARFNLYYLSGIALTVLYGFASYIINRSGYIYLSSYYINMAMFFAFATLWPETKLLLFFFIPIKIKWLAYVDLFFFAFEIIIGGSLLPLVAILNYLIFCGSILMMNMRRSGLFSGAAMRNAGRKSKFKKSVRAGEEKKESQNYRHKCCVCGRTDTDYPELEFRYCSRCVGYHCFCQDHINNHIHFKE